MLRSCLLALTIICATTCAAGERSFGDFYTPPTAPKFFEVADGTSEDTDEDGDSIEQMLEESQWRPISFEAYNGLIASKRTMWSGGLGMAIPVVSDIAVSIRAEFNMELGAKRDFRPQTRGFLLEPGVRFHLDFDENVALYSTHGPSFVARFDFYKLDGRTNDSDTGRITSFGIGTSNTVGLEFGDDFIRGFVETGLRTSFIIFQDADQDVEGFKDNIRTEFRFQWLVLRIGVRIYV